MDLQGIWKDQYVLQQMWHDWNNLAQHERDALVKDLLLHLHEETGELQRLMDQARYHLLKQRAPANVTNIAEAGADVLKLLVALMLLGGVNSTDFEDAWWRVSNRVVSKWRWEQDLMTQAEVLLCDIDGVLAQYSEHFRQYAAQRGLLVGNHINTPDLEPIKDEFHAGGGFSSLPTYPGAIQVVNAWRHAKENRRLVLVTARPYKRYRGIYSDTVNWCHQVGLKYDHILFEHDKAEAVRQVQPARIIAHIEDRGKHALEVAHTGVLVLKLPYAGPEEQINHPNIRHVADWAVIAKLLQVEYDHRSEP